VPLTAQDESAYTPGQLAVTQALGLLQKNGNEAFRRAFAGNKLAVTGTRGPARDANSGSNENYTGSSAERALFSEFDLSLRSLPSRPMTSPVTMHNQTHLSPMLALAAGLFLLAPPAGAFEGRISATVTQGGQGSGLLYIAGTNVLRIEKTDTNWPHARNLVDLQTGSLTLLFPHNRSFVRLKPVAAGVSPASEGGILPPGFPPGLPPTGMRPNAFPPGGTPGLPAAGMTATTTIGPTNLPGTPAPPPMPQMPNLPKPPTGLPAGIGPPAGGAPGMGAGPGMAAGMPAMPAMPPMPMMPGMMERAELKATGHKTNLLGYACERFELKQRRETLEIWATDQLFPFVAYQQNQPHPGGPRGPEEQWPELMKARRFFPLLVTLRFENGPERYRFEVKSVKPEKIRDPALFQPPPDYQEIEPLPF
jgi:hypothetical protein